MDVAFAGCGSVARDYASGLKTQDGLDLVAVVDTDRDRAATFAGNTGCVAFTDVGAMLAAVDPAVVVNLTSHTAHAQITRQCLESGVHVYSEKPLALDPVDARDLVSLAETNGIALGCAPVNHRFDQQQLAAERLADGTLGDVKVISATAHVGRVTDWHDRPGSFLTVGPLFDGAVYPLTLLVEWFGPVTRIRTADTSFQYPDREAVSPSSPTHVEATFEFGGGPIGRLTASYYVPHTARDFYSLEIHGDDGSLSLDDAGDLGGARDPLVAVGGVGREYTRVPLQRPPVSGTHASGVGVLADSVKRGTPSVAGGRRGAHVVAICDAIVRAADVGESVTVDHCGFKPTGVPDPRIWSVPIDSGESVRYGDTAGLRLPPIGFGCSRYRDGEYVDRVESVAMALDAGYRLLDSAELYGNEDRIGEVLGAPGSPDREAVFVVSKVWNTNHGYVREACESTLAALGLDTLDSYLLHWPASWQYTGPLRGLASMSVAEQEAETFPTDEGGNPLSGGVPLEAAWQALEQLQRDELTRSIGICNIDRATLDEILGFAEVLPAIVQVERHPYLPRTELVDQCHRCGIRVLAHSPVSARGLLSDPVVRAVADKHDASPAQVVLAWNVDQGVVPIPSSNTRDHIVENAMAPSFSLDRRDHDQLGALADPSFER